MPIKFLSILLIATTFPLSVGAAGKYSPKRIKAKINFIKENVSFPFRLVYGVKVVKKSEPNAYALGTHIVVTTALLDKLNDRELLAVIAHEMGHRERHHIFSRAGMYVGSAIVALFDWRNDRSYVERLTGFNESYGLAQEIQADCHAYNWLQELKHKGHNVDPLDLNSATNAIVGFDLSEVDPKYFEGLPEYIRFQNIARGHSPNCD